jgi:branched-chain amino acid transport system substrate-binding protein
MFLIAGQYSIAATFRVAGLYAASSVGHFNCTCNEEAACITKAVIDRGRRDGLDISYELIKQEHNVYSTLKAANDIAAQKFDAVLGTLVSSDALVSSDVFEKAQIPFIAPVATHPRVTAGKRFTTRVAFNDFRQATLLARLAVRELHTKSVVIIRNVSQPYSDFLGTHFASELRTLSPDVVVREFTIIGGFTDTKGLMDTILSPKPDLIFVPLAQETIASIYSELEARETDLTLLASDTVEKEPKFLDQLGPRSRNIRFVYPQHWNGKIEGPEAKRYWQLFSARCGQYRSSMTTVAAYDAAELLVRALAKDSSLRGERLITAIRSIRYHGMTGNFRYGPDGDPVKPLELFELKKGKVVHWMRYE